MVETAKYTIVGRYMDGASVTAYHLLDVNGGQRRLTREQVIFLVGKGDITNCKGQIHKENVILRGVGVSLNDLPVVNEKTGGLKNTENLGRVARGATTEQALAQFMIVGRMMSGSKTIGFTISNAGGATRNISREQTASLAEKLKIGNARIQEYKGRKILRLINGKMEDLPVTAEIPLAENVETTAHKKEVGKDREDELTNAEVGSSFVKRVVANMGREKYSGELLKVMTDLKKSVEKDIRDSYGDIKIRSNIVINAPRTNFEAELNVVVQYSSGKVAGIMICVNRSNEVDMFWNQDIKIDGSYTNIDLTTTKGRTFIADKAVFGLASQLR